MRDHRAIRHRHRPRSSSHVHIINHHDVHHHYDHYEDPPHHTQTVEKTKDSPSTLDFYITAGTGMSALAAPQISFDALPGGDFNLGLGAVGELIGFEMGLHSALFRFDPTTSWLDVILMGVSTDLKVQPSLSFIEPFVSAGLGAYHLRDTYLYEGAGGASFRLATGLDLRFSQLALSFRYQRNFYYLFNDHSYYGGLDAQTESFGLNLSFYL